MKTPKISGTISGIKNKLGGLLAVAGGLISGVSFAQQENAIVQDSLFDMPEIKLTTKSANYLFTDVPGAITIINNREIGRIAPVSNSDVMRKVSGINVVDEDGAGNRMNIGIRGLNPIRSSKVLVLEDGIPITLNPYGEPQMYFSPLIDKMESVEVLKGSGQILFGPQTIGGVVNFRTANPPKSLENRLKISAGDKGFFSAYASHGNTIGKVGYLINYNHKRADNLGPLGFNIHDASAKILFKTGKRSEVGVKAGFYNETSNATYLGITQAMYDANQDLYTTLTPNDHMAIRKLNFSVTHNFTISENIQLQTTAFAYSIARNWRRQQFTRDKPNEQHFSGQFWGDSTRRDGGAIFMNNRTDWRNRQYEVGGIESKLSINHQLFGVNNTLQTGVRGLYEKANEQFIQGNKPDSWGGNMRDNEVRSGLAISAYALNTISITEKLSANVGFRVENFDFQRRIYRGRFNINGQANVVADTNVLHTRNTFAFLPGAGLNYAFNKNLSVFTGIHRGFAPPVVKSAITPEGTAAEIDKELSTNIELGARFTIEKYFSFSPTLFYMNFENQVIPVTLANNAIGSANGGRSLHQGIEFDANFDVARAFGSKQSVAVGGTFTYVDARFSGDDVVDNFLPYAPQVLINNYITADLTNGFGIAFYGTYVGEQYTDRLNTVEATPDGTVGKIDARYIMDATIYYTLKNQPVTFKVSAKNLANQKYITSRNPQGIRVGLERFITAGIDIRF